MKKNNSSEEIFSFAKTVKKENIKTPHPYIFLHAKMQKHKKRVETI